MNRDAHHADAGFTFVELIIASMLSIGILILAGWMLLASLYGGRDVTASGTVTSQAQLVVKSIRSGLDSAANVSLAAFASTGQLLKAASVEFNAAGLAQLPWVCEYWAITADGRVYTKQSATATAAPATQDKASFAGWTLLGSSLERVASEPILSHAGTTVGIKARSDAEGGAPAYVDTTATVRTLPASPGSLVC
jgi:hypothetical protein